MWWGSWPRHASGWLEAASKYSNISVFKFEEMSDDIKPVLNRLMKFLAVSLNEKQLQDVIRKSGFNYMKENEDLFEMVPPNVFSVLGTYFKKGTSDRSLGLAESTRKTIYEFCRVNDPSGNLQRIYPAIKG